MLKVNVLLLKRQAAELASQLGRKGYVHLVDATRQTQESLLRTFAQPEAERNLQALQALCVQLHKTLGLSHDPSSESTGELLPLEKISEGLKGIQAALPKGGQRLSPARQAELAAEHGPALGKWAEALDAQEAYLQGCRQFGQAASLCCVSGWIPKDKLEDLKQTVELCTGGACVVEVLHAEEDPAVLSGKDTVPVTYGDGGWLAAFRMLVTSYGTPSYQELDPTAFVAISFALLFGIMFGDIGQGAVLALAGWWLRRRPQKGADTLWRDGGTILIVCGLAATLFGFAYGSFFGYENHHILKPLWLNPLEQMDIPRLLLTAVGVGIVLSSLAILFNIFNHIMRQDYFEGIFNRNGLMGLLFYWLAIGIGVTIVLTGRYAIWQIVLLVLPLAVLFLAHPLHELVGASHAAAGEEKPSLFALLLESCIELMETLTGYLSGTVSFVRVGAFAISHGALCLAVWSIVQLIHQVFAGHGAVGFVVSCIVVVLGNALVIAFEGMVALIQGIRLEYYELFSKYFSGGGVPYAPYRAGAPAAEANASKET